MWPVREKRSCSVGLQDEKLMQSTPLDMWIPELTGEPTPHRQRVLSGTDEALLWGQAQSWLEANVIEQTHHLPAVNNPVFVEKKNGSIRVCIDCRPVNEVTKDWDWPLPRLQELRHRLGGTRYYVRIDLRNAFFRFGIPTLYRRYTAFRSRGVTYQFKKMPFGLKTAPALFQRFMDHIMSHLYNICLWYLDDILVFANDITSIRQRLKQVRHALRRGNVEENTEKTTAIETSVLFAGIQVYPGGTGPNRTKLEEALNIPVPKTKKEKQSALGLVSYLREFIPLASHFTAELYPGKGNHLTDEEYQEHWTKLLDHIKQSATTLSHWNEQDPADLYTDASGVAVAAVLIQNGRISAVASRKLKGAETRYSTTDREHLSLVFGAEKMRVFLHRTQGVTRTWNDHAALIGRNEDRMTPKQWRWNNIIRNNITSLQHVKGENNPADYFSRWGGELPGGQIFV